MGSVGHLARGRRACAPPAPGACCPWRLKRDVAGPAPVIGGIVVLGLRVAPCRECEEIRPGDRLE